MFRFGSLILAIGVVIASANYAEAGFFGRRGGCHGGSCSVSYGGGCYSGGCSVSSGCYGGACAVPAVQGTPADAPPAPPQANAAPAPTTQNVSYGSNSYNYGRRGWFGRRGR